MAAFYQFINTDDPAYSRLFNDDEYAVFFEKLKDEYFSLPFFQQFCTDQKYAAMIPGYIGDAAVGIYRLWQAKPAADRQSLEQLAERTTRILTGGLNGINDERQK